MASRLGRRWSGSLPVSQWRLTLRNNELQGTVEPVSTLEPSRKSKQIVHSFPLFHFHLSLIVAGASKATSLVFRRCFSACLLTLTFLSLIWPGNLSARTSRAPRKPPTQHHHVQAKRPPPPRRPPQALAAREATRKNASSGERLARWAHITVIGPVSRRAREPDEGATKTPRSRRGCVRIPSPFMIQWNTCHSHQIQKSLCPWRHPRLAPEAIRRPDRPVPRLLLARRRRRDAHAPQRPGPRRGLCPRAILQTHIHILSIYTKTEEQQNSPLRQRRTRPRSRPAPFTP